MAFTTFLRAGLAGASCGSRTFTAPAVTLAAADGRWRGIATALAAGELIADKVPSLPARTQPGALVARFASGAYCGGAIAGRSGGSRALGAVCGGVAAVASAQGGFALRRYLTTKLKIPDAIVALAEDGLAFAAARRANAA